MDPSQKFDSRDRSSAHHQDAPAVSFRPILIVLFAVILLSIAGLAQGQEQDQTQQPQTRQNGANPFHKNQQSLEVPSKPTHTTIQYDGISHVVPAAYLDEQSRAAITARHAAIGKQMSLRPKYVEMHAELANFDADADPDGWRVQIVLLDGNDRPVVARSNVVFELMPRVPTPDHYSYVDAARLPVRWSMSLKFDDEGVARLKLPLRESLWPIFGWTTSTSPYSVSPFDASDHNISRSREIPRLGRPIHGSWRTGSVATRQWRNQLGRPLMGELRARVSVPGQGVFHSVVIVPVRHSTLVDTRWPYR